MRAGLFLRQRIHFGFFFFLRGTTVRRSSKEMLKSPQIGQPVNSTIVRKKKKCSDVRGWSSSLFSALRIFIPIQWKRKKFVSFALREEVWIIFFTAEPFSSEKILLRFCQILQQTEFIPRHGSSGRGSKGLMRMGFSCQSEIKIVTIFRGGIANSLQTESSSFSPP